MNQSDTWFDATLLTNAGAGESSDAFKISTYTKVSVIAKIATGQLDIKVSNDGTDYVTHTSITADGYVELTGYSYMQVTVASGTVESASMVGQRRSTLCASTDQNKNWSKSSRLRPLRGWSKGNT